MKRILYTMAAIAITLAACTPQGSLDNETTEQVLYAAEPCDTMTFCCYYRLPNQPISPCVTMNCDCTECEDWCEQYPVRKRTTLRITAN